MRFVCLAAVLLFCRSAVGATPASGTAKQYILINTQNPDRKMLDEICAKIPTSDHGRIRMGFSCIFSYLAHSDEKVALEALEKTLRLAEETNLPIYIQLDGEVWWQGRPDLWNWWDPKQPGFNPENRNNVEWSSWDPADALKISWLNWGRQIRMLPTPNFESTAYRTACHKEMRRLIPAILKWADKLPTEKKGLFVGIKLGWESSLGVNQFYYPNGNDYLGKPESDDPTSGIKGTEPPARGVSQIGYAALKTAGIRMSGSITEADLADVAQRHLADISQLASTLGVPRDKLFTHGAGWKDKELLYGAAVNQWSCPGWSCYRYAADPTKDEGVQEALRISDAPYWAATEWLYQGAPSSANWRAALEATLAAPRCRLICIFNWASIESKPGALEAIKQVVDASGS